MHGDDVAEADAEVLAHDLVQLDLPLVAGLLDENDADRVLALLPLEEDGVATEELELLRESGRRCEGSAEWL